MELIRKIINLDDYRSRRVGIIDSIPYGGSIVDSNGNYGNFVKDAITKDGVIIKYLDIIRHYNIIQKELRNAIFLKNIGDNRFMVIDSIGEYNCGIKQEIEEEYCRYDFIPHNINDFINIKTNCYSALTNCDDIFIVLLENIDKYQEIEAWWSGITGSIGNFQFCKDFESLAFDEREIKKHCAGANNVNLVFNIIPTIDIPLLLENTTISEELYYPYEYSVTGNTKTEITLDDTVYNAVIGTDIAPSYKLKEYKTQFMDLSGESIFVESKLQSLKSKNVIQINDEIEGIFTPLNKLYKYENEEWSEVSIDNTYKCADGEQIEPGEKKYRNIPIKQCINYFDLKSGAYYFLVKYENNKENPLKIPFKVDEKINEDIYIESYKKINEDIYTETHDTNVELTIYDKIEDISYNNTVGVIDSVTIKYALGVTEGKENETGIHYKEVLNCTLTEEKVILDNTYECDLWVERIDYDLTKIPFYNEELKQERWANQAQITGMEVLRDIPFETILFTKDSSNGLQEEPKYDINLTFNRGAGAAWEKHFKLSECNTMEDLENYGNNYFNL